MKIEQLIESMERGLDRAESADWIAFSINADNDAAELLDDLQKHREMKGVLRDLVYFADTGDWQGEECPVDVAKRLLEQ